MCSGCVYIAAVHKCVYCTASTQPGRHNNNSDVEIELCIFKGTLVLQKPFLSADILISKKCTCVCDNINKGSVVFKNDLEPACAVVLKLQQLKGIQPSLM